jgi:hypothetical protein
MIPIKRVAVCLGLALIPAAASQAHVGQHPSVHDTVAGIIERLRGSLTHEELVNLDAQKAYDVLTEEERHILGTEHITFTVNRPVEVYIMRDVRMPDEPFWLKERGFQSTGQRVQTANREFDVWKASFEAGTVGLGVPSLSGAVDHYFVGIRPQDPGATLQVTDIYPGEHTLGSLAQGERPYTDSERPITVLPDELKGMVLLRGANARRRDAQLVNVFRMTDYPATGKPDHIILTWSDDPKTSQTVQWRTSVNVTKGAVAYRKKSEHYSFASPKPPTVVQAETKRLDTPTVLNDPSINRHTAVLRGLEPGTTYVYAVGDGSEDGWTELAEFTTAPEGNEPFSFIYMGDAQNGLERWGILVKNAFQSRPDAAFYIMAGDLVNRGAERDDWDRLFENAKGVYDRRQLVPVLGNHEYQGGEPNLYLEQFTLLTNGPSTIAPEKAYSFRYSNALFVVLDSNLPADTQAAWLEEQLANTDATWKFVVYHHPAYSSGANRDNREVRTVWGALFDKYHVDLALQGHDHAYLRTYPMKNEQRVASPAEGTIYIVSVSGTKFYEQPPHDYTEVGMTNTATYQVLDIQIDGNRLVYRAYDVDGKLKDEFVIEK